MPILYHCTSSRGLRPLWTIEEMGIDCELVVMPYPPRTKAPEFLQINPLGTIPFLVDGDTRMSESAAIPTYLANRYGPTELLVQPDEPDYGAFLDLVDYGEASLMGALATRVRFKFARADLGLVAAGDHYGERFAEGLSRIEAQLADGRDHLCAGRFTLADISVCYALFLARLTGLGEVIPAGIGAYADRQFARPSFQSARARERAAEA